MPIRLEKRYADNISGCADPCAAPHIFGTYRRSGGSPLPLDRAMLNITDRDFSPDTSDLGRFDEQFTSSEPRLLNVLLVRKRLILLSALAGAFLFGAYAFLAQPTYTAEALVVTNQPEFGQEAPPLAVQRETQIAALLSEIDIIKSPAFIARIVNQFDLTKDPELNGSSRWLTSRAETDQDTSRRPTGTFSGGTIGSLIAYAGSLAEEAEAQIRSLFQGAPEAVGPSEGAAGRKHDAEMAQTTREISRHLSVSNDSHSITIQIKFWANDPYKASRLANAFADNYVKDKLETKQQQSAEINTWLDGRIGDLGRRVVAADRAVQEERKRLNLSEAGPLGTVFDQTLLQWNTQLITAQTKRLEAEARLTTARKILTNQTPTESTSDVLGSPLIQRLREQKGLLTAQYASMVYRSGPNYPAAIALKREIDDLSESLRTETHKILDSLANEVETATRAEKVVKDALNGAQQHANSSQLELTSIRELDQRAASERILYDQFLRKFNETLGHNYLPQSDVRTVSPASPPDRPSYPKMMLFAPAGFLLGMFFGAVKALHSAGSDRTFKVARTMEAITGLPTLVRLNSTSSSPSRVWLQFFPAWDVQGSQQMSSRLRHPCRRKARAHSAPLWRDQRRTRGNVFWLSNLIGTSQACQRFLAMAQTRAT
jgi:polysaccharide biosynthesis transport protein